MLVLENQRWDQFSRKLNGIGSTTLHFWALGLRTSIVHWLQGHGHIFAFYRCECFCTVCVISTNVLLRFLAIPSGAFNENWESCWYTAALVYLFFFCFYLFCNSLIWVLMWGNFSWKRVGEGVFPWFVPFLFPCICIFLLFSYLRFFFFFLDSMVASPQVPWLCNFRHFLFFSLQDRFTFDIVFWYRHGVVSLNHVIQFVMACSDEITFLCPICWF